MTPHAESVYGYFIREADTPAAGQGAGLTIKKSERTFRFFVFFALADAVGVQLHQLLHGYARERSIPARRRRSAVKILCSCVTCVSVARIPVMSL
jgi:hypothetical protein